MYEFDAISLKSAERSDDKPASNPSERAGDVSPGRNINSLSQWGISSISNAGNSNKHNLDSEGSEAGSDYSKEEVKK